MIVALLGEVLVCGSLRGKQLPYVGGILLIKTEYFMSACPASMELFCKSGFLPFQGLDVNSDPSKAFELGLETRPPLGNTA
mmetsp:Transcript_1416/g.2303  ORF Transcript_1416/g.2303 Transcript_1416/m.2303 type:complete len:81 (-) Transcript_1416:543-785(-)